MEFIWIFNGVGATFPNAVFTTREKAEAWINENRQQGMLTKYPVDISVYDYAIRNGWFTPKHDYQHSPEFFQRFTSASQEHYHYEDDALDSEAETA